jgi:hypothetical protein
VLDISLSKSDVPSFFLVDGFGDDLHSLLEVSSPSAAFEHSFSPYRNLIYRVLPSTSSG